MSNLQAGPSTGPTIHYDRCEKCGRCVRACPNQAITLGPNGPNINCTSEYVERCTYSNGGFVCVGEEICPHNVIAWEFEIVFEDEESGLAAR